MKTKKIAAFIILISSLSLLKVTAQSGISEWNYIFVREDIVNPNKVSFYEASLSDLNTVLVESNVKNYNCYSHLLDNFHFVHIIPLDKLSDIEKGTVEFLKNQVDEKAFNLVWSDLSETITASTNYILKYRPELSYAPSDIYWGNDTPYRRWNYMYFIPGSEEEAEKLLQAWKKLYENKNVQMGFRVFSGFIGVEKPLYVFTMWATNPYEYQNNLMKAMEILGEEGTGLWRETMNNVRKINTIEGWFLPQYSFLQK
jgi:hypothetical protein